MKYETIKYEGYEGGQRKYLCLFSFVYFVSFVVKNAEAR